MNTKTLLSQDLNWCVGHLPKELVLLMRDNPQLVVAGGFIRAVIAREEISDIDLFLPSKDDVEAALHDVKVALFKKCWPSIHYTKNATTLRFEPYPWQFVHRWFYDNPVSLLDSFDFTIARAAIWFDGKEWQSACSDRYYADLAAKRLVYCSPKRIEEVGGSMLRVLKFYQKGYRISVDDLGAVIARLSTGVILQRSNETENESDAAKALTKLLREVDPAVDFTHAAHLPSENTDGDL